MGGSWTEHEPIESRIAVPALRTCIRTRALPDISFRWPFIRMKVRQRASNEMIDTRR